MIPAAYFLRIGENCGNQTGAGCSGGGRFSGDLYNGHLFVPPAMWAGGENRQRF